jgi:hypothetical protein
MNVIACYFYYAVWTDGVICQSVLYGNEVYFHSWIEERFAYPDNIVAVWRIKFKSI